MTAVSLSFGGGIPLIKPTKLFLCMQKHYKHKDECMVLGVGGHGSATLRHAGNIVTRIGLQQLSCIQVLQ